MKRIEELRRYPLSVSRVEWVLHHALVACVFVTMVGLLAWVDRVLWGPW